MIYVIHGDAHYYSEMEFNSQANNNGATIITHHNLIALQVLHRTVLYCTSFIFIKPRALQMLEKDMFHNSVALLVPPTHLPSAHPHPQVEGDSRGLTSFARVNVEKDSFQPVSRSRSRRNHLNRCCNNSNNGPQGRAQPASQTEGHSAGRAGQRERGVGQGRLRRGSRRPLLHQVPVSPVAGKPRAVAGL